MPAPVKPAPQRIILTGFMGAGKSTVGRLLAGTLGWVFVDLDAAVEQRTGRRVPEIFAAEGGEAAFRRAETEALAALLTQTRVVIALGGGALETADLRLSLQGTPDTLVVHLYAPFALLYDRCRVQARDSTATERPLLRDRAVAEARYRQRSPLYTAFAEIEVDAAAPTPDAVVAQICAALALPSRLLAWPDEQR